MGEVARVLGDRYEVGEVLGRGGMAEVRAALDHRLGRRVAVKLLRPELAGDPVLQARFRREARSVAALNHPGIVAVYDTGEDVRTEAGGAQVRTPYMVMELVAGRTLRDLLDDAGGAGLGTRRAVEVAAGVLTALQAAHDTGIVHRDVKPANVMVTPDGSVTVMDFGIARSVVDASATVTQTDSVMGTALYLSSEQARGEVVDARTDQYSCACLLYEALTGRTPFVGDYPVAVAYQHVSELPQPPSVHAPAVDDALDRVVLKALSKDRDDRYADAQQFRDDLLSALAGRAVLAPPVGSPPRTGPSAALPPAPRRGKRALVALAATLLVAVVSLSGWLPQREVQASDEAAAPQRVDAETPSAAPPAAASSAASSPASAAAVAGGAVTLTAPVVLPVASSSTAVDAARVTIGDYSGQSVRAAAGALQALGLTAAPTTETSSRPAGEVLRQSPAGGAVVDVGSAVRLVVSSGAPAPSGGAGTSTVDEDPASSPDSPPAETDAPGSPPSSPPSSAPSSASGSAPSGGAAGGASQQPPPSGGADRVSDTGPGQGAGRGPEASAAKGSGKGSGQGAGQGRAVGAVREDGQQGRGAGAGAGRGNEKQG